MAHVVFQLCVVTSFFMVKTEAFFSQPGEAASKRGQTPPPTFLEAPQEIHYFVTRKQPANLTWVATDVCKMQIKCNKEKFRDGNNRVCKQTCRECKTRRRTKIVTVKDFPEGVRSMTCQCKVWGTKVIKTEKIIMEKAFLLWNFGKVKLRHVAHANATVILRCKPPRGYPLPNITWYKNGEPLFFCCGRSLRASAKKLVIEGVSKNDSGDYQCVAENMAARRQGPMITLEVRGVTVEVRKKNVSASDCNKSKVKCYGDPPDGYKNGSNKSSSWDSYSPLLIVGTEDEIVTFELQNNSRERRFRAENVASLECDYDKRHIYWSNRREINELSLDTGVSEIFPFHLDQLNSVASPNWLAFDWINHKLYWTDAKDGLIYLGDLRNRRRVRLIEGKRHIPKAIATSSSDGFIYWTVWGQVPKIMRARLDGTEGKELVSNGITFPNALALDESNRRLFWAGTDERKYGIIESVSLDGLNRNVTFYRQGYYPYSLDIYEGFVYWADWGKKAILRISSNGGGEKIMFNTGLKKPMGVKICQERTFEENHGNSCDQNNGGCDYLCVNLHFSKGPRCMCQKDMNLKGDGKTCEKTQIHQARKNKNESLIPTWAVVIIVVMLLFALPPTVYIVKKLFSHFTQVDENVREDIGEEPATERTGFIQENLPPSFDASAALSQQLCKAEPLGAGATGENSSVRFQRDLVIYNNRVTTVNLNTVNMNTAVNTNMNTTNNYNVVGQNGGMTVVGDNANINNYHQPPQN